MAAREGYRRMYLVGKAVLAVGALLDLFLIIGLVAAVFGAREEIFAIGMLGIPPTLLGIAILAVTWIAEGFGKARPSEDPQRHSASRTI